MSSYTETYRNAYSHGLEEIYTLENVDIKSVKTLSQTKISPPVLKEFVPEELNLGAKGRGWMTPLTRYQPIWALNLSKQIEKVLLENGKTEIGHLLEINFAEVKGLGQGHIDEIKTKIQAYLQDKPLKTTDVVDFGALILVLFANCERKKGWLLLERYELGYLMPLSFADQAEIKRLPIEMRNQWEEEAIKSLQDRQTFVHDWLRELTDAFVCMWMNRYQGLCRRFEIKERCSKISQDEPKCSSVLLLIKEVWGLEIFDALITAASDVYASDEKTASDFEYVQSKALSYFYKDEIFYSLDELVALLYKECVRDWLEISNEFIIRTLRLSPLFVALRGEAGSILIYKS